MPSRSGNDKGFKVVRFYPVLQFSNRNKLWISQIILWRVLQGNGTDFMIDSFIDHVDPVHCAAESFCKIKGGISKGIRCLLTKTVLMTALDRVILFFLFRIFC